VEQATLNHFGCRGATQELKDPLRSHRWCCVPLDEVHKTLASWRLMARQVSAQGPAAWRRLLAKAERTLRTGERPSGMVPMEEVDELIRERLGR